MNSLWVCICLVFLTSCNVIKMIKDDAKVPDDFFSGGELFLDITYEPAYRNFYTHSDTAFREIFLDYPWDATLECSSDGGATFTDCGQINTYTWDHANYTSTHVFKVIRDGEELSQTFTPSSAFPGITFGACIHDISYSTNIAAINSLTLATNDVICIANGVVISNSGSDPALNLAGTNIKVVANVGDYAVIENTTSDNIDVIVNNASSSTHFYGLTVNSTVQGSHAFFLSGSNSSIWDCDISSNDAGAVKVTGAASSVSINNSSISNDSLTNGAALFLQDAQVNINESFISGGFKAIEVNYNATNAINIDKSIIASYKSDYVSSDSTATIDFSYLTANNTVTTNITDSVVESSGGPAIRIGNIGGNVALNFIKSKIIRTDNFNESSTAVDCVDELNITLHTVTADADTLVCNLSNTTGQNFSTIAVNGGAMNFDVTTMNAHTSNTDIGICPYEDGSTNPISY